MTIANRYQLLSQLGRGGMGVVWAADDTLLRRKVAIKEVELPAALPEEERAAMQARALREARAAARLTHPSAVTVYDVHKENGRAFIVMELVEAPTLGQMVKDGGPLSPQETARIGLGVLSALETAHGEGIVHRDVKPGNVMVLPDQRVKLADFGIASLKGDPKITATGLLLGSPSYMAPEQAEGGRCGPPADLWALGATMYYAVEGEPAFDKGQPIPTLTAVLHDDPRPPQRAGDLAPVLTAILDKDPGSRPGSASLRRMLEGVVSGPQSDGAAALIATPETLDRRRPEDQSAPEKMEPAPTATAHERPTPPRRGKWSALLAGLLVVGLVAGLILWMTSGDRDPSEAPDRRRAQSGGSGAQESAAPVDEEPALVEETRVPASWAEYVEPQTGFRISHPPDWQIEPNSTGDGDSLDLQDPAGGTYLRIDWTDEPGPSAEEAWEVQAENFAQDHANYEEITIEPVVFQGYEEAAVWEFTYDEGGARLHAIDLGFVTGEYGFALNFQTHEEDWVVQQDTFRRLQASFVAPD